MSNLYNEIKALKERKNAIILAHYYVPDPVQEIADYIGDSFYLSKKAKETQADIIVFAGVLFMGESAKMLNPGKKVLMPDRTADCPMAHMGTVESVAQVRAAYEDVAAVCYINSTTELKAVCDVCVTSSNAVQIVKKLPQHTIFFTPDRNLGHYVSTQVPDKKFILNQGYCPVHECIEPVSAAAAKAAHPGASFLVHPECRRDVLAMADYIGSTSGIIQYAAAAPVRDFIIGTEEGVFHELTTQNPDKKFYPVMSGQCCDNMKKITLEKVRDCLRDEDNEVILDETICRKAVRSLDRMLELAK
jgi:quinolinate synthase